MLGNLGQVLSVLDWLRLAGVILQTPHHRDNVLLLEHNVEECRLVDEKQCAEYVIEMVQPCCVFQVFADVEEFEEFWDVVFSLYGLYETLSVHGGGDGRRDEVKYLFKFPQFAERKLDYGAVLQVCV